MIQIALSQNIQRSFPSAQQIFEKHKDAQSPTLESIKDRITIDCKAAYSLIIVYLYGSYDKYRTLQKQYIDMPKGLCAKSIQKSQQTYRCDDCGRQTNFHIYCGKCFETGFLKGLHKGHRYKSKNQRSGCCDCGDVNAIEPSGYCPHHNGSAKCDIKLEQDFQTKLRSIISLAFDLFFFHTQQKFKHIDILSQNLSQQQLQQLNLPKGQNQFHLISILSVLLHFITVECKQKLPILFSISNLFLEELNQSRKHTCNQTSFKKAFQKIPIHNCKDSIVGLLFKYTIALQDYEKDLSAIIYCLFVNQDYKLRLSQIYLLNFKFLFIIQTMKNKTTFMKGTDMYLIYCQFFGDKYTDALINSAEFHHVIQQMRLAIKNINGQQYNQTYRSALFFFQMFVRLKTVCEKQKQQSLALKLLGQILNISDITNKQEARSFDHHKIKIFFVGYLMEIVLQLISVIKYEQLNIHECQFKLIQTYLLNTELEKQSEPETMEYQTIKFKWFCLPDLIIGSLLTVYYSKYGKQKVQQLFSSIDSDHKLAQKFISRIVKSQIDAYRISKSNEVGFPGQFPPKDLYRYFYKQPSRFVYDTSICVLQIMAVCLPQQLLYALSGQRIQNSFQLISDILLQESCFVNVASKCQIQNKLYDNSLKLQLVNIINLRNRSTFKDLKQTFISNLFSDSVTFDKVLQQISILDAKQTYSIRPQYQNMTESLLVKRCDDYFSNIFEEKNIQIKLYNKNKLMNYQIENKLETICLLATKSLGQVNQFIEYYQSILSYIWVCKSSVQNYQIILLISLIYKRNLGNESIQNITKTFLQKEPETILQKIVIEALSTLTVQQNNLQEEQLKVKPTNKVNRMKAQLQKFKKKQQQFISNNQDLVNIVKKENQKQQTTNQEEGGKCLICQNVQNDQNKQYPGFIMFNKTTQIQGIKSSMYLSCGHIFHRRCLNNMSVNFKMQCPLCKHPLNNLFTVTPQNQMSFLSRDDNNYFSHSMNVKPNFFIGAQKGPKFSSGEETYEYLIQKQQNPDPQNQQQIQKNQQNVIDLVVFKTYFSIIDSITKFYEIQLRQLRCLYSFAMSTQLFQNNIKFLSENKNLIETIQILPDNRISSFIKILKYLFLMPFAKKSIQTRIFFQKSIYVIYTKYFVCNFLCFVSEPIQSQKDIETQLKIHQDAINAQMNEFCKGIAFAYSIIFDDPRNQILKTLRNQDKLTEILTQTYPQFFSINKNLFETQVLRLFNHPSFNKSYQSLIPIPQVIDISDNYLSFHQRYNDLMCNDCQGIIRIDDDQSLMCLKCGYKCCLKKCPKNYNAKPSQMMYQHFEKKHNGQAIFIDLNSSLIFTYDGHKSYYYAYIYRDKFNQFDSDEIKNWSSLQLDHEKWSKLLELLRKRNTHIFSIQSNKKQRL